MRKAEECTGQLPNDTPSFVQVPRMVSDIAVLVDAVPASYTIQRALQAHPLALRRQEKAGLRRGTPSLTIHTRTANNSPVKFPL